MRVLIVDDSVVFRSQIKAALEGIAGIVVAGSASNGIIGLERLKQQNVDVVILDLEMPGMDGITMLREMKKREFKQKVIVFSAMNRDNIDYTFNALSSGASDFIVKPISNGSFEETLIGVQKELVPKILQFKAQENLKIAESLLTVPLDETNKNLVNNKENNKENNKVFKNLQSNLYEGFKPKAIAIGASTGGPPAIEKIFQKLKEVKFEVPIFLVQHMPPKFTEVLASRLREISSHPVSEAKHGETVFPGHVYVAPGDFHMTLEESFDKRHVKIVLDQSPKRNSVRPSLDSLFESLAKIYGSSCAAFVLTGMGEDGKDGAQAIKSISGQVIIQDQTSSTVWGMPKAVYEIGAYDIIASLDECTKHLVQLID